MIYDVLIIGSGIAGLFTALSLPENLKVAVVTKRKLDEAETSFAQGGISCVISPKDSFERHIQDTLNTGAGISKRRIVEIVVKEGPQRLNDLVALGVKFTKSKKSYDLHLEGGHSRRRIVHVADLTGKAIEDVLIKNVRREKNIAIFENHIAVNLIKSGSECWGAYVLNEKKSCVEIFRARKTVIATGGAGKCYLYTSNPDVATGDGIAMAYRIGCRIKNMEFVQFHPTCLFHPEAKSFLISESVRGEGALLFTKSGKRFMPKYHPMKELAPRDIVARAIDDVMKKTGDDFVYLDISHRPPSFIKKKFPYLCDRVKDYGFDMTKEPIPVVPAAHYICGGIAVDEYGKTDVENLFAAGETACTGLHGANRLASNSLLEGVVLARRVAHRIPRELEKREKIPPITGWKTYGARPSDEAVVISQNWDEIRRFMWNYVGIVRSMKRLERAFNRIKNILKEIDEYYWNFLITRDLIELRNIARVSYLMIKSAMMRKESRGTHFMIDFPKRNDTRFLRDTVLRKRKVKKLKS
ncbi:MAG: L-aspartate oxidase [Elusimicrobia bacterium]|nr:L-aspartate oxidase [Elusimicrobiota bacterium]